MSSSNTNRAVTFTAHDLDQTIELYRRIGASQKRVAQIIEETVDEGEADFGRLPAGSQGPHSPTD